MQLENIGSLITYKDDGGNDVCLGYLFNFTGHGVFSPDGKVEVSPEDADTHNKLLDEGMLLGLDNNCQIGQHGTFYYTNKSVHTWCGAIVADSSHTSVNGVSITFRRGGKTY